MRASARRKTASCASQARGRCAPECARRCARSKRVGARGVCASVRAGQARRSARSERVGARGASASECAEPASVSGLSSRSASRGAEPSGPAGSGLVPRVAARQPSAPGGAGRLPLRWELMASSSLSHAGAQRVLSCRAAWRVLSLRSVRATYLESEERRHGAKKHQSQGATSSCTF